jgi:spore coat protein U-like protein
MVAGMLGGLARMAASLAAPVVALAGLCASAAPAATVTAQVNANIVKPLAFTATGSLNFGTIVVNNLTASRTITLSPANVLTCGGSAELVCSGPTSVPTFNVQGTNKSVLNIFKNVSQLTNTSNGSKLALTPIGQNSVTLTNSGAPGSDFAIGGSITLTPTTTAGTYSGVVDVTVEYQ